MRRLLLLPTLLLVGCTQPKTVTRTELEQLKLQRQEPMVSMWYYQGSKDGFHYFHHDDLGKGSKDFRIADNELSWTNSFPLASDRSRWTQLDWGGSH